MFSDNDFEDEVYNSDEDNIYTREKNMELVYKVDESINCFVKDLKDYRERYAVFGFGKYVTHDKVLEFLSKNVN
jgi:hypothetical protein